MPKQGKISITQLATLWTTGCRYLKRNDRE